MPNQKIELISSKDSKTGVAGREVDGVFQPNTPISSTALEPQADFEIPEIPQSTMAEGEQARFESQTDAFTQGSFPNCCRWNW